VATKVRVIKKPLGPKVAGNVDPPDKPALEILEVEEIESTDPFASLWDDDENQNVVVDLIRIHPETILDPDLNENVRAVGFLEALPPGLANYYEHIQRNYGGGVYRATKKIDNKIRGNYKIEISGRAKLPPRSVTPGARPSAEIVKGPVVDGVDLSGTDAHFEKMLQRLLIMKKVIADDKPAVDVNKLLSLIVDRPGQDPFRMMQTSLEMINTLKENIPDKETGAGWLDVLNNAIDKVGKLIAEKRPSGLDGPKPPSAVQQLLEHKTVPAEGNIMPNYQQAAASAIVQIIASFNLEPPHTAKQAAECLDAILNLNKEQRAQIKSFKSNLLALAETEMSKQFEVDGDMRKEFSDYFNAVFDEYTNPERQTFTFEIK